MSQSFSEELRQQLEQLGKAFEEQLAGTKTDGEVEVVRVKFLGRKSPLASSMKQLGVLPADQRAEFGKTLNTLKTTFEQRLSEKQRQLLGRPAEPPADVTLPGVAPPIGRLHPITQTIESIVSCFVPMGFEIVE